MAKKQDSMITLIAALFITCLLAGLGLSFTHALTKEAIAEAEVTSKLEAVKVVMPGIDGEPEMKTVLIDGAEREVFIGRKSGKVVFVATSAASNGYSGAVNMLVGADRSGKITGMVLLQHTETPGLGAKAGEKSFLSQFLGKKLAGVTDEFKVTKDGGEIESITAATITSRAVAQAATKALRIIEKIEMSEAK